MALIELNYDEALKLLRDSYLAIDNFWFPEFPEWQTENLQCTYISIIALKAKCEKFLDLALQMQQKFD